MLGVMRMAVAQVAQLHLSVRAACKDGAELLAQHVQLLDLLLSLSWAYAEEMPAVATARETDDAPRSPQH